MALLLNDEFSSLDFDFDTTYQYIAGLTNQVAINSDSDLIGVMRSKSSQSCTTILYYKNLILEPNDEIPRLAGTNGDFVIPDDKDIRDPNVEWCFKIMPYIIPKEFIAEICFFPHDTSTQIKIARVHSLCSYYKDRDIKAYMAYDWRLVNNKLTPDRHARKTNCACKSKSGFISSSSSDCRAVNHGGTFIYRSASPNVWIDRRYLPVFKFRHMAYIPTIAGPSSPASLVYYATEVDHDIRECISSWSELGRNYKLEHYEVGVDGNIISDNMLNINYSKHIKPEPV